MSLCSLACILFRKWSQALECIFESLLGLVPIPAISYFMFQFRSFESRERPVLDELFALLPLRILCFGVLE